MGVSLVLSTSITKSKFQSTPRPDGIVRSLGETNRVFAPRLPVEVRDLTDRMSLSFVRAGVNRSSLTSNSTLSPIPRNRLQGSLAYDLREPTAVHHLPDEIRGILGSEFIDFQSEP
jgi:hypothetical protein